MTLPEVIFTVLDGSKEQKRDAFRHLVRTQQIENCTLTPREFLAVLRELSTCLSNDTAKMPLDTCEALALPDGAIYARGADRLLERRVHRHTSH